MSQRKLLLPPFHGESVRRYAEVMAEATAREVDGWPVGREFALRPRMQAITLEVILRAVFGVRDGERMDLFRERIPRLGRDHQRAHLAAVHGPRPRRPLTGAARFRRALAAVDELIYAEIADRRESEPGEDVLSLLLSARHEDGSPMSDVELRDELMTLLTAGHETTATGLSWAFERLMRTPRVMDAAARLARRRRVPRRRGEGDAAHAPGDRGRGAQAHARRPRSAGYTLPAGTLVLPAIAAVHVRPDLYPEPDEFRPERFIDGQPESYAWIPFGGGVRRCIGASFAQVEMRVVLREVLRRVRLSAPSARPERPRVQHVTVVPGARRARGGDRADARPAAPAEPAAAAPGLAALLRRAPRDATPRAAPAGPPAAGCSPVRRRPARRARPC